MHLHTLPTAQEFTALQARRRIAQRPVITLILNELERALERGLSSITLQGTLPVTDKDMLCEHGFQIYERLDHCAETTTITWDPQTPEPEGDLYRSNAQAAHLLGLAIQTDPETETDYQRRKYEGGGTTFNVLALLASIGLMMFGLLNVTLERCARAAVALQTWLAGLPTLSFAAWCAALLLAWVVSLSLAWLISATREHERHLNLSRRIKRRKSAPQGEHRFYKFTLTPADQPPLH